MMITLQYQQDDLLNASRSEIDQERPFEIVVTGQKVRILKTLIATFSRYHETKKKGGTNKFLLLPLALSGIWFPTFCAVLIYADTWRVETNFEASRNRLTVSFMPPNKK